MPGNISRMSKNPDMGKTRKSEKSRFWALTLVSICWVIYIGIPCRPWVGPKVSLSRSGGPSGKCRPSSIVAIHAFCSSLALLRHKFQSFELSPPYKKMYEKTEMQSKSTFFVRFVDRKANRTSVLADFFQKL